MYVVLLGPPGSGKTHLGLRLNRELGYAYIDRERRLVEGYGSVEAFAADKAAALAAIEDELWALEGPEGPPVVVESTGVSDRLMLEGLMRRATTVLVRVDAPRRVCVDRVRRRPAGGNFNNDARFTATFHDHWCAEIAPTYAFDLVIRNDGRDLAGPVDRIRAAVDRTGPDPQDPTADPASR